MSEQLDLFPDLPKAEAPTPIGADYETAIIVAKAFDGSWVTLDLEEPFITTRDATHDDLEECSLALFRYTLTQDVAAHIVAYSEKTSQTKD